jgi:hypothetical protein
LLRGADKLVGWRGGRGSIVLKTPDTALYSKYVSTLCAALLNGMLISLYLLLFFGQLGLPVGFLLNQT